jgi:hypothetical protein
MVKIEFFEVYGEEYEMMESLEKEFMESSLKEARATGEEEKIS